MTCMASPNRQHLSDIRGISRMACDATAGITRVVERMHRTIQLRPWPFGEAASGRTRGITGLVYRSIQGITRLIGVGVDSSLAPIAALLPEGESGPARDAFLSVLNGVYGDYLSRTGNPLAMDMSLRYQSRRVDPEVPPGVAGQHRDGAAAGRLLLLVHGLCLNDRQWQGQGHDHGAALAEDLGYLPLYLRYNSGLHVESNGMALAGILETLVSHWPHPVQELVIVGYSMGGLVARSACQHGADAGHAWPERLRKLVFLATPQHGAPLERGGQWLDYVMDLSPYSAPLTRIGRQRSAGISDLCHGSIRAGSDEPVALPAGVQCYAAAAILAERPGVLDQRLIGDGLVPLDSALGRHPDPERSLAIPQDRQWIGYRMGHLEMLYRTEVYAQLRAWLAGSA